MKRTNNQYHHRIVGKKIRQHRKSHGWTQQDMADKLGVSRAQLGHLETGYSVPSFQIARRAYQLGMNLME